MGRGNDWYFRYIDRVGPERYFDTRQFDEAQARRTEEKEDVYSLDTSCEFSLGMAPDRVYLLRVVIPYVEGYMRKLFGAMLLAVLAFSAAMTLKTAAGVTVESGVVANVPAPPPPLPLTR